MPHTATASLTDRIQQLLDQREQHASAIAAIDQTIEQINGLLGGAKPGRKPGPKPAAMPSAAEPPAKRRRRRQRFTISGEESVLAFVKEQGKPTSQEIERQWTAEGRKGRAAKALSKLTREKKLTRTPIAGKRGSRYTLAVPAARASGSKAVSSGSPALTGQDFVLQLLRQQKNLRTAAINARWKAAGRPGRANKVLGVLVRARKLNRNPVKNGRGSRYAIA